MTVTDPLTPLVGRLLNFGGAGSGRYPKGSGKAGVGVRENHELGKAAPAQIKAARKTAKAKYDASPTPTDADRAEAKARHARSKRQGGDDRPSSYQRRKLRQQIMEEFGDGSTCPCVNCGRVLTPETVSLDRIIPGSDGGNYKLPNLVPMDYDCNRARSNTTFTEMSDEWEV